MKHLTPFFFALAVLVVGANDWLAAGQHAGQVTFGGLPVPGATVTASQGDRQVATTTDQQGIYRFADLADGVWSVRVEMLGFSTLSESIAVAADAPPSMWELKLLPFEEITRGLPPPTPQPTGIPLPNTAAQSTRSQTTTPTASGSGAQTGFQRAGVTAR